jgi:hypothetical protein
VFVPNNAASGNLMVAFSRNPRDFPVMAYVQAFPTTTKTGLYKVFTSRNAARILTSDDAEHIWADGEAAPSGIGELESFIEQLYSTIRRAYPFLVGQQTAEQAPWSIVAAESRNVGQKAMTARTMLTHSSLSGAAWGSNTATVTAILGGGKNWTNGSTGTPIATEPGQNIRKTLQYMAKQVNLVTLGQVRPRDLSLVVNPTTAQAMAASTEILDYVKQAPDSVGVVTGQNRWMNRQWDVPDMLYGYRVIVEDAVRVSSRKESASDTLGYVMPDGYAYLLATPQNPIESFVGSRSFTTVQMFFYQDELTVETMYDQPNRRIQGRVVSDYAVVVASTYTGFLVTGVLG